MKSKTRQECEDSVRKFADYINNNTDGGNLLYCGLAGDPKGGEYSPFFKKYKVTTLDICECWGPDIVADITDTKLESNSWDLIVCVQTIEHVPNIFDISKEVKRILKPGGYFIVDSPFNYPYHGEPQFGDFWRISKDGMKELFSKDLELVFMDDKENNTSALYRKSI